MRKQSDKSKMYDTLKISGQKRKENESKENIRQLVSVFQIIQRQYKTIQKVLKRLVRYKN